MFHRFVRFFWFGADPKTFFVTLKSSHSVFRIGTHPSKMGEELLYYHLNHEEAQIFLDVRPELFNSPFIKNCRSSK